MKTVWVVLKCLWLAVKCLFLVAVFVGIIGATIWIGKHPVESGEWYAKFQKSHLIEFNKR